MDLTLPQNLPPFALKKLLDERLGKWMWKGYEPETILMELGWDYEPLLFDKIMLLKLLEEAPNELMDSPIFFLMATDVANNHIADFDYVPSPTSLEAAWAITQFQKILSDNQQAFVPGVGLIKTVAFILKEDGFSKPIQPFSFIPEVELSPGASPEDMIKKSTAIKQYINHMETGSLL